MAVQFLKLLPYCTTCATKQGQRQEGNCLPLFSHTVIVFSKVMDQLDSSQVLLWNICPYFAGLTALTRGINWKIDSPWDIFVLGNKADQPTFMALWF